MTTLGVWRGNRYRRAMTSPISQRLSGKHALVTGGGSGIGRAISERFAAEGAHVFVMELNEAAAADAAAAIRSAGGKCDVLTADVSDTEGMRAAFAGLPGLNVLVNNAGIAHIGNVLNTTAADMDRLHAVNVRGVYHGMHFGIPLLQKAGGGAILNICSVAAKLGISDRFAYSMTKGAVLTMTKSIALDGGALTIVGHWDGSPGTDFPGHDEYKKFFESAL